jgi:hypothetical protein
VCGLSLGSVCFQKADNPCCIAVDPGEARRPWLCISVCVAIMLGLIVGIVLIVVLTGRNNNKSTDAPGSTPLKQPKFIDKQGCAMLTQRLGPPAAQLGASDDIKKHSQWYQGDELYPSERASLVDGANTERQVTLPSSPLTTPTMSITSPGKECN